jgi:hypothetical protein
MRITASKLFPYSTQSALDVVGVFNADVTVSIGMSSKNEEFVVFNGEVLLLGKNTTKILGVLKAGLHINQILVSEVKALFPTVFRGLGKLKGFQLRILINSSVKSLVQHMRSVPFHLQETSKDVQQNFYTFRKRNYRTGIRTYNLGVPCASKKPKCWRRGLLIWQTQRVLFNTYTGRGAVGSYQQHSI